MAKASITEKELHKKLVGRFVKNKLEEYKYYFIKIIKLCDLVDRNHQANINPVNNSDENINYLFNALANNFQALKDSLKVATGKDITWARLIENIRHAKFVKESRNAIAHDGMEVINAYADGKYFVANEIKRIDEKDNSINIDAPDEDILSLIYEFTYDLMITIEKIIKECPELSEPANILMENDIFTFIQAPTVPEFARKMVWDNKLQIQEALSKFKINIKEELLREINAIKTLCPSRYNISDLL